MPSTIPEAVARLLTLRGFAWADELPPSPHGNTPVLSLEGEPAGHVDVPRLATDGLDEDYSIADEIEPLSDDERVRHLEQLEQTEIDVLQEVLSSLGDEAREWLRENADDDGQISDALFNNPEDALQQMSRRQRTELLGLLREGRASHAAGLFQVHQLSSGLREVQHLRDTLFRDSLRLVLLIVRERRGQLDFASAVFAGCKGLEISLDRFEPSRGYQLSTFATWWIRQGIVRQRDNHAAPLRTPPHRVSSLVKLLRAERALWIQLRVRPDRTTLRQELDLSPEAFEQILDAIRPVYGARVVDDAVALPPLAELVCDPGLASAWEGAPPARWVDAAIGELENAFSRLPGAHATRQAAILRGRLGIGRARALALREIGEDFGVTRERIRQLQVAAIKKLRLRRLSFKRDVRPWRWRHDS